MNHSLFFAGLAALLLPAVHLRPASAQPPALQILDIRAHAGTVGLYEKFELTFEVTGTGATNPYFPYDPSPPRINVAVKLEQVSDANYAVFLPLVLETQTLDKWALWTNGAQLCGANIWQRIRVPDLDDDLLGEGYIGPPYAQSDFDRLAALGVKCDDYDAEWVNGPWHGEWLPLEHTVTAGPEGRIMIFLQVISPLAENTNAYFDNVEVWVNGAPYSG